MKISDAILYKRNEGSIVCKRCRISYLFLWRNCILELNKYIKELQKSFLTDKESEEKYLKEAYERTKSEVNVSHVLIRYNEINDDSLHIISKLSSLRDSFSKLSTNDFNNLWNLDKKMIVEDLGYFSAFKMIYS